MARLFGRDHRLVMHKATFSHAASFEKVRVRCDRIQVAWEHKGIAKRIFAHGRRCFAALLS
jgi:hypothetical protein